MLQKPKIFQDLKRPQKSVFKRGIFRVNLSYRRQWRIPVTAITKAAIAGGLFIFLSIGWATAPTVPQEARAQQNGNAADERAALEAQLRDLENQINQYEGQIAGYQKQGSTLSGEIKTLNDKVSKLNLQIKAINLTLTQLDKNISDTQFRISSTEASIDSNREALGQLVRNLYENDRQSLLEIFLSHPRLSDFFGDVNSMETLQNSLRVTINRIADLQNQLKDHETQLSLARADAQTVQQYQAAQKQQISEVKQEKNTLLQITRGQETKYQQLLKQTKQTAAQIRARIFELLGGGELTFEQAYQYAKMAGDATGVRPAFILAVLDRESALGRNVGRCSYKTAMSPSNQALFLELTKGLSIDPETVFVSCPNGDGVYGGAMGPAQFIPSTWNLYKDRIAKATGHTPASPWNNADAFVATALYMQDAGAVDASISQERIAAAKYYAGSNWRRYLWTYGEAVVSRAEQFQADIDTITG